MGESERGGSTIKYNKESLWKETNRQKKKKKKKKKTYRISENVLQSRL
jgi:hypothetical protein